MTDKMGLGVLRASIRERLCKAIAGDEGLETLAAGHKILPVDALMLETGYLMAELLAKHPIMRDHSTRATFLDSIAGEAQALIEGGVGAAQTFEVYNPSIH